MCYNIEIAVDRLTKIANRRGHDNREVQLIIDELWHAWGKRNPKKNFHHTSAFDHELVTIVFRRNPLEAEDMQWGLIPSWVKDEESAFKLHHQTTIARSETMFEKPVFRNAAAQKRGVLLVTGFFEHHHLRGKTFPHYIYMRDGTEMKLGILHDEWANPSTGEIVKSFAIVTTRPNSLLERIHNNPKAEGPRMPFILRDEDVETWLDKTSSPEKINEIIQPYHAEEMDAYTVRPLSGRLYPGNVEKVTERFHYAELDSQPTLFD